MSTSSDPALDAPPPRQEPRRRGTRARVGVSGAELVGWVVVATINQVLVVSRGLDSPLKQRLLHHAYDAGQLVAAGVASFAVVELARRLALRARVPEHATWPRALTLALVCFVVTLATVRPDVANAAARHGVPVWIAQLSAALCFGLLLGALPFLAQLKGFLTRAASLAVGICGAVANGFVLKGDYPAAHLFIVWFSAVAIAEAVAGVLPWPELRAWPRRLLLGACALLSFAAVVVPPSPGVLGRLYSLPTAPLIPFLARFYPEHPGPALELVRRDSLGSPWFQSRTHLPAVPPSRALTLPAPKIVVFLTVDALRADVVTKPEYLRNFPGFTALRQSCAFFGRARSAASSTRPSLASVFSGLYVSQLRYDLRRLDHRGPMLAELVSAAGVRTVSLPRLVRISANSGVGRGFKTEIRKTFNAEVVVDKVIEFIRDKQSTFLFAHFGEPHAPYSGKGSRFERYLQEVERVDRQLLRLFRFLEQSGLSGSTLLVVTADHGEGFGEHGMYDHARIVYEEVARVPLFVCGPGIVSREISEPVSLIDVAPTILDAFDLPTPGTFMGQSLLGLATGAKVRLERPIAFHANGGWQAFYLRDGLKVLLNVAGRMVEVYDLNKDPAERVNLVESADPAVRSAVETARLFFHLHQVALAAQGGDMAGDDNPPPEGDDAANDE